MKKSPEFPIPTSAYIARQQEFVKRLIAEAKTCGEDYELSAGEEIMAEGSSVAEVTIKLRQHFDSLLNDSELMANFGVTRSYPKPVLPLIFSQSEFEVYIKSEFNFELHQDGKGWLVLNMNYSFSRKGLSGRPCVHKPYTH